MGSVLRPVIPELGALVRESPGTLSLAQGMVGWAPPAGVLEALQVHSAADGTAGSSPERDGYGAVQGDPELLKALAESLRENNHLDLDGGTQLVTAGSNMGFHALAQVLCEDTATGRSEIILPLPYYFNHVMAIQLAGGVPVVVDAGLVPDVERLAGAITARTRAIVTISPNNPSGVVMPRATLEAINTLCARHGLIHISDEAYGDFVYEREPHWSPGSRPGSAAHTVTLQSLSKAYGMAGWRIGFMAVPQALAAALAQVQDTVLICPPRLMQRAALAALQAGPAWCAPRIADLAERRLQLLRAVAREQAMGLPITILGQPDGAFYVLLQIQSAAFSGDSLMRKLVLEHQVATLSGESFGLEPHHHGAVLRLSYGLLSAAELAEALRRLFCGVRALLRQRREQ